MANKKDYELVNIIAGDSVATDDIKELVEEFKKKDTFYSDLLYSLASERFSEEEAKKLWQEILQHKYFVSEKLGRNIGVHVATLDYLENIKKIITGPKIIEESDFEKIATTDTLTSVYNRRALLEKFATEINISKKTQKPFSLLLLDLDGFKKFNDTQGHQAGDIILQEFAHILKGNISQEGIIGRYGGDEMVIILPGTDKISAQFFAEKIRFAVETEFKEIGITVSIGLVEYPLDGKSLVELLSQADEVLYRAKEFGGNKIITFKQVRIVYSSSQAKEVYCVGDFSHWRKMPMEQNNDEWSIMLTLKPGEYRYKFLIDGSRFIPDPLASKFTDDGFGGKCSVLVVPVT